MHNVAKDQPVRLAHWMAANNWLTGWFLAYVKLFNVIQHD
jgi:hypothetical protein